MNRFRLVAWAAPAAVALAWAFLLLAMKVQNDGYAATHPGSENWDFLGYIVVSGMFLPVVGASVFLAALGTNLRSEVAAAVCAWLNVTGCSLIAGGLLWQLILRNGGNWDEPTASRSIALVAVGCIGLLAPLVLVTVTASRDPEQIS